MLRLVEFNESLKLTDFIHVAHCCIFSLNSTELFDNYTSRAMIYMQMRFDGRIGFPGGIIKLKEKEDILQGLNRELKEEINLNPIFYATEQDYMHTHLDLEKKMCFHFYAKKVSKEEFNTIEKDTLEAEDFGVETFGLIRVPTFVMQDKERGLPFFLKNNFAGCAKIDLLSFLIKQKLFSQEDINAFSFI